MATIQGIYVALFGRPADPGGLAYWNGVTNNGSDLSKLIGQLTASQEYLDRFKGKTNAEIVTTIYQSLFGRAPDAGGLDFFTKGLANGTLKLETLAINILDGAQGSDKSIIDNKTAAADLFTKSLDTQAEIDAYKGNGAADLGRAFLTKVTDDKTSIPSQTDVDKAVAGVVTPSGGQGPSEGGSTGGGGSNGPSLESFTVTHKNGDITNATADQKLFAGGGNPATGMQIATAKGNQNHNIELALDARYSQKSVDVAPSLIKDDVAIYSVNAGADVRFAYSAGITPENGNGTLNLDSFDYKLLIDTDKTAGTNFVTLSLARGEGSSDKNVSDSPYVWSDGTFTIKDDGGSVSTTQNIQALQWYNGNHVIAAGDQYDIKLQAFYKGTNTQVAETAIKLVGNPSPTLNTALSSTATHNADKLLVGSGNSNGNFAVNKVGDGHIELGLSGRVAGGVVKQGSLGSDGLVHFTMDSGDNARFAYSISSDNKKLSEYTFKLKIDTDGSEKTSFVEFTLADRNGVPVGHQKNNGGATDSAYVWKAGAAVIADDGGDGGAGGTGGDGKVTQNIENIAWFDNVTGDSLAAGSHYDVILEAWSKDGATLIGTNHVVFDITGITA